jgi:hypothetical protein
MDTPDLDVVVRGLLRDIGSAVRPLGFRGSGGVCRVTSTNPAHGDRDGWRVTAGTDIDGLRADLLTGVTRAADRLVELLEPDRYVDEIQALPNKQLGHWPPLVVLLAERGPSPELDAACTGLRDAFAERPHSAGYVDRLTRWAHARASR